MFTTPKKITKPVTTDIRFERFVFIDAYKSIYTSRLECVRSTDVHYWYGQHEAFVAKYMFSHLESLAPHCHITRFPRMQHGQLVIDHPDRVSQMLVDVVG